MPWCPDKAHDPGVAAVQVEADWQAIKWESVEYLQYLGLQPWYAQPTNGQLAQDSRGALVDINLEPQPNITIPGRRGWCGHCRAPHACQPAVPVWFAMPQCDAASVRHQPMACARRTRVHHAFKSCSDHGC